MSIGERLAVGLIRGVHGLRGALRVEILTDRPEDRFQRGAVLFPEGSEIGLTITSAHADEPGWLVRFAEVRDRTAAEALRNTYLESEVEPGDELARGEYYWHEVIGTVVTGVDGTELGRVEDVYRVGGAEVFIVRGGPYGEFDVPAVRAFVRIFAPRRGEIVVDAEALDLEVPRPKRPRGRTTRRAERGGATTSPTGEPAASTDAEAFAGRTDAAAPDGSPVAAGLTDPDAAASATGRADAAEVSTPSDRATPPGRRKRRGAGR